ncbi:MAG TPA: hypothetical protein PK955_10305 [Methanoregulaceae archaeon]|nr:hypothetical protein [Methanoregulaceae archaeon]
MKPQRISILSVLLAVSMILLVGTAASAEETAVQPQLPHAFYGSVEVAGSPANAGISVEAAGIGVRSNITGNPVDTLPDGTYGKANFTAQKLIVQGNIAAGTSLHFYVGGLQAEVYDVAAGGPWKETYPFEAGGETELNIRIASQPAAGQTRVPTPTQTAGTMTNNQAGTSSSSSSGTTSSGTAQRGATLPQVPSSPGQQTTAVTTQQVPSGNMEPGTVVLGQGVQEVTTLVTGTAPAHDPVSLAPTGTMPMYIAGAILLILIIAGGAYYFVSLNRKGTEETTSDQVKEPEEEKD